MHVSRSRTIWLLVVAVLLLALGGSFLFLNQSGGIRGSNFTGQLANSVNCVKGWVARIPEDGTLSIPPAIANQCDSVDINYNGINTGIDDPDVEYEFGNFRVRWSEVDGFMLRAQGRDLNDIQITFVDPSSSRTYVTGHSGNTPCKVTGMPTVLKKGALQHVFLTGDCRWVTSYDVDPEGESSDSALDLTGPADEEGAVDEGNYILSRQVEPGNPFELNYGDFYIKAKSNASVGTYNIVVWRNETVSQMYSFRIVDDTPGYCCTVPRSGAACNRVTDEAACVNTNGASFQPRLSSFLGGMSGALAYCNAFVCGRNSSSASSRSPAAAAPSCCNPTAPTNRCTTVPSSGSCSSGSYWTRYGLNDCNQVCGKYFCVWKDAGAASSANTVQTTYRAVCTNGPLKIATRTEEMCTEATSLQNGISWYPDPYPDGDGAVLNPPFCPASYTSTHAWGTLVVERAFDTAGACQQGCNPQQGPQPGVPFIPPPVGGPPLDIPPTNGGPAGGTPSGGVTAGVQVGGTTRGGNFTGGTPVGGTPTTGTPTGGTPSGGTPSGGTPSGGTPPGYNPPSSSGTTSKSGSAGSPTPDPFASCPIGYSCTARLASNVCQRIAVDCRVGYELRCSSTCGNAACAGQCCQCVPTGTTSSARSGASSARSGASSARSGASSARSGASSARSGASSARSGASSARSGASSARSGSSSERSASSSARSGSSSDRSYSSTRFSSNSSRSALSVSSSFDEFSSFDGGTYSSFGGGTYSSFSGYNSSSGLEDFCRLFPARCASMSVPGTGGTPSNNVSSFSPSRPRTICGNGVRESGEQCDDGNTNDADACSNECRVGIGSECSENWQCSTNYCQDGTCVSCVSDQQCGSGQCVEGKCSSVCGNGMNEPGEQCDDGNRFSGDGCDAFCKVEATRVTGLPPGQVGPEQEGPNGQPPVGSLTPIATGHAPAGTTGPATVAVMAAGAAIGFAAVRRMRRRANS